LVRTPPEIIVLSFPLTDQAALTQLEPWQWPEFLGHVDRARAHLDPWLPWVATVVDEPGARAFLQRYADSTARDAGRLYGIRLDGALVGGILFRTFDVTTGVCELGVWLDPSAGHRGLVTEAAKTLAAWAFRARGMRLIEWRCTPANARSKAVADRLGMAFDRREGDLEVWTLSP
jgi:ribosomal-protein-serine acetyltransferase